MKTWEVEGLEGQHKRITLSHTVIVFRQHERYVRSLSGDAQKPWYSKTSNVGCEVIFVP